VPMRVADRSRREIAQRWRRAARSLFPGLVPAIIAFVVSPIVLHFAILLAGVHLSSGLSWFLAGAYTVTVTSFLLWAMSLATATGALVRGVLAEWSTAHVLAPRAARRRGWRLVHGLYFIGHGDVDHVLLCPRGVWAVETKWTSEEAIFCDGSLSGPWSRSPVVQARAGAEVIDKATRLTRARAAVSPRPLLVIWGPGAPELPDGFGVVDGVVVLSAPSRREVEMVLATGIEIEEGELKRAIAELSDLSSRQSRARDRRRSKPRAVPNGRRT
jgi:hypothetical protein